MSKKRWILLIIALILVLVTIWVIWSNVTFQTTTYTVSAPDLPNGFDGYRIIQLSDLHNTSYGQNNKSLLDAIKKQAPDIIVVTGDLIDSYHTNVEIAAAFMEEAVKIAPCYYVYGNHEVRMPNEYDKLRKRMNACGVTVLEDQSVTLERNGDTIVLAGLMDYASLSSEYITSTFRSRDYTILLTHRPDHFEAYAEAEMDLVLAGHTHGGQIRLPIIGSFYAPGQGAFPKYDVGMYEIDDTTMIISQGLGNSSIPFRFNCRPELVVIEMKCK